MAHTVLQAIGQLGGQCLLLLNLLAPFALQPALSRIVWRVFLEFLCCLKILGDAGDSAFRAVLWSTICRGDVAKGWPGLEEGQQRWWEFVSHFEPSTVARGKDIR